MRGSTGWSSSTASGSRPTFRRAIPDPGPCAAAVKCAWAIWVRSAFWSPSSRGTETKWWSTCRKANNVDANGERWRKTVLDDGGIAAADCIIDDFTGDDKPDIVCIGASTCNLKLYENLGK